MNVHRSLFLAASLSLASCANTPVRNSTHDAPAPSAQLTVQVVEASGGA